MRKISFCDKDEKVITLSKNGGAFYQMVIDDKGKTITVNLTDTQLEILLNSSKDLLDSVIIAEDA